MNNSLNSGLPKTSLVDLLINLLSACRQPTFRRIFSPTLPLKYSFTVIIDRSSYFSSCGQFAEGSTRRKSFNDIFVSTEEKLFPFENYSTTLQRRKIRANSGESRIPLQLYKFHLEQLDFCSTISMKSAFNSCKCALNIFLVFPAKSR